MQQTDLIIQTVISLLIFIGLIFLEGRIQKKTLVLKITKIVLKTIGILAGMIFIAGIVKLIWK